MVGYKNSAWYKVLMSKHATEDKYKMLLNEVLIGSELAKELLEEHGYKDKITTEELYSLCEKLDTLNF